MSCVNYRCLSVCSKWAVEELMCWPPEMYRMCINNKAVLKSKWVYTCTHCITLQGALSCHSCTVNKVNKLIFNTGIWGGLHWCVVLCVCFHFEGCHDKRFHLLTAAWLLYILNCQSYNWLRYSSVSNSLECCVTRFSFKQWKLCFPLWWHCSLSQSHTVPYVQCCCCELFNILSLPRHFLYITNCSIYDRECQRDILWALGLTGFIHSCTRAKQ